MNIFEGLDVGGPAFFRGTLYAASDLNITGALTVAGATALNGGMAATGTITFTGTWDGWIGANETWTYASSTTFTVASDVTGKYQIGDKIKLTQTTVKYFYIVALSFSSGTTTVTVTGGTDYSLANAAITSPFYSKTESPQAFPHWYSYTPTLAGFGTVSNTQFIFSIAAGELKITGKWLCGTTAASAASLTIPSGITLNYSILNSFQNVVGGWAESKTENISSNDDHGPLATDGSDTGKIYFARAGSSGGALAKANGNSVATSNTYVLVQMNIPLN